MAWLAQRKGPVVDVLDGACFYKRQGAVGCPLGAVPALDKREWSMSPLMKLQ